MGHRQVELEPAVRVAGHDLIPIVWTVERRDWLPTGFMMAMCREAIGIIVRNRAGLHVYLADGRDVTIEQFVSEYPSLTDVVSGL